jgi:putative ABC transport system permease protein
MGMYAAIHNSPGPEFVPHPIILQISIMALIFTLSVITFNAGVYPARRAAEMTPANSLRYE